MNAQAIQSTEILVRFANPARDGKPPSICASDNTFYGVKPVDFGRFQQGGRYRIDYVEKDGRGKWAGRKFRDIVKCETIRSEPQAPGDARGARAPSPRPPEGEGVSGAPSEFEFVTRMLAAYVQCCGVGKTVEDLVTRARSLQGVYREVWG